MMTMRQIYAKTLASRKEAADYVRILNTKKGYNHKGRGYVACTSYSTHILKGGKFVPHLDKKKYVTVIVFQNQKLQVQVSCSCYDFMYRWEYALYQQDAADLEMSNGEPPTMTNPSERPGCCKHLVALYKKIKPSLPSNA